MDYSKERLSPWAVAFLATLVAGSLPAQAADVYTYDPVGRLASVTHSNGVLMMYTYDPNGNILSVVTSLGTTGVETETGVPLQFALGAPAPNPGSGPREIPFSIPVPGRTTMRVFDVSGRLVATLLDRDLPRGRYVARFGSERFAGGVYYYRLTLGGRTLTGRMVTLR